MRKWLTEFSTELTVAGVFLLIGLAFEPFLVPLKIDMQDGNIPIIGCGSRSAYLNGGLQMEMASRAIQINKIKVAKKHWQKAYQIYALAGDCDTLSGPKALLEMAVMDCKGLGRAIDTARGAALLNKAALKRYVSFSQVLLVERKCRIK